MDPYRVICEVELLMTHQVVQGAYSGDPKAGIETTLGLRDTLFAARGIDVTEDQMRGVLRRMVAAGEFEETEPDLWKWVRIQDRPMPFYLTQPDNPNRPGMEKVAEFVVNGSQVVIYQMDGQKSRWYDVIVDGVIINEGDDLYLDRVPTEDDVREMLAESMRYEEPGEN